jgi:chromosome segregation ATPase
VGIVGLFVNLTDKFVILFYRKGAHQLHAVNMSGDADAMENEKVKDLRRLFEESATQEIRTIQEIERNMNELSEYIDQLQRFCLKKSSEIKDLRRNISDSNTGRMISGYSVAKDVIQQLEKKVAEKNTKIMRLRKDVAQRDLKLSMAETSCEKNNSLIQELNIDITEKQKEIEEMSKQIAELKQSLQKEKNTTENQRKHANPRENECCVHEKDETISRLRETNYEQNVEIKNLREAITQLQKNLTEKENEHFINKRLSNIMKIQQLEPLAKKSREIEELLNNLKQETANITDRLACASTCTTVSTRSSETVLRGSHFCFELYVASSRYGRKYYNREPF